MEETPHEDNYDNRNLLVPARNIDQYVKNSIQEVGGGAHAYVPMDRAFIQFQHNSDTRHGHHSVHYVLDNGRRVGSLHWHKTYGTAEHEGEQSTAEALRGKRGKPLKGSRKSETNNVIRYTLKNVATSIANHYGLTLPRN